MATAEVYVWLPLAYNDGKHILSWVLSHFPKDDTKIIATVIHTLASNGPLYSNDANRRREEINKTLDKHVAQCAIQKFKAEKLIHENNGDLVEGTLELIDLRVIKNLVIGFPPNRSSWCSTEIAELLAEKANPSCKIWFIDLEGNLLFTRCPKSDLTEATSEEIDPGLNMALHLSLETELQQREKLHQKEIEKNQKRENESSMATAEVKEEQKVYVCLPWIYDEGKHILSWALSHFPKDETKIVATYIGTTSYSVFRDIWRKMYNKTLDKHLAQCAIEKFKAEKLIHEIDHLVEGTLGLIDSRAITNLVMGFSLTNSVDNSKLVGLVAEKANPTCKIWFIDLGGNLLFTRYPKSDLTKATSEEGFLREKLHQKEIEVIQKRENEQLKLENQLLRNQQNDNHKQKQELEKRIFELEIDCNKLKQERKYAIKEAQELRKLKDLDKQIKQQLEKCISDLEIDYTKLKQERDNAIKEAQELRKQKEHSFANSDMVLSSQFSLSEMEQATQNFSDLLKIGEGGFGCVYKGSLRKTTVAIKKLNSESLQGLSEFQQEVAILNRVRHPNIVNLIGSCSEISTLVYEFLPNGSLENRLACADNTSSLTWQSRTRIISEICLGLVFLHSNKPHLVIHGDLKPDNILLDANFISKLSDFGISKIIKQSDTNSTVLYRTTHPAGAFAYIDPQYLATGELTPKSDVYSFGIIMLRLLTGKHALNIANEVQESMRAGRLMSIVDQSAGKWPFDLVKKLAKLGLRCADISRRRRPDTSQVWATIEPLVKTATQSKALSSIGSSTSNEEHVPSHFLCPIMQEIMKNPCIAADGFTYEGEAIKTWLNRGQNTSPMTNLVLPHRDLIPNHVLRSAIQEWLQQHPQSN